MECAQYSNIKRIHGAGHPWLSVHPETLPKARPGAKLKAKRPVFNLVPYIFGPSANR